MKNKLIVLEGIDGVGKTSVAAALKERLCQYGEKAVIYEECEDKNSGFNIIKPFIRENVSVHASLFFYLASAIYKSEVIQQILKKSWVICDRYIYSTIAYHKVRGVDVTSLLSLQKLPILFPDFYFLLIVKEDIRMKRIKARGNSDKDDMMPKHEGSLVDAMERELKNLNPIVIDNSSPDIQRTVEAILEHIL